MVGLWVACTTSKHQSHALATRPLVAHVEGLDSLESGPSFFAGMRFGWGEMAGASGSAAVTALRPGGLRFVTAYST